jgi:hypothetical protein
MSTIEEKKVNIALKMKKAHSFYDKFTLTNESPVLGSRNIAYNTMVKIQIPKNMKFSINGLKKSSILLLSKKQKVVFYCQ